ncbi:DUF962 domain-containing protein [Thermaurantimonas aggregans]|uniref:Mpo1 family 2-hydroxy fatty acid dioxygenase n=1 Tax=Thermaurantimonas aggregans TaxID=2173829 RepID=UPI0023F0F23E|nr:Mpo1-like protein [Thermaurantimonas aggregans]MCX8149000.1 DUF962 domain-containing protein [Thermaurantimonas aggregans]
MKTADQWFDEYGQSHQNPTNKTIHWICVPLIFWSILGLFYAIPVPETMTWFNWSYVLILLSLIFYLRLSLNLFVGIALFTLICLSILRLLDSSGLSIFYISITVFVLAWIGQFIGHKIEGKKPSFFKDLQFLLIGPAWLMHFLYKKWGISY